MSGGILLADTDAADEDDFARADALGKEQDEMLELLDTLYQKAGEERTARVEREKREQKEKEKKALLLRAKQNLEFAQKRLQELMKDSEMEEKGEEG
jgi:hypothetical protein